MSTIITRGRRPSQQALDAKRTNGPSVNDCQGERSFQQAASAKDHVLVRREKVATNLGSLAKLEPSSRIKGMNLRQSRFQPSEKVHSLHNRAFVQARQIVRPASLDAIASAYDHVGDGYGCYADGEGLDDPSAGENRFAHADAFVWETIRKTIDQLSAAGVQTLRVLDAGCGPGTWTRRIATYADRLGLGVEAIGIDISTGQLEIARKQAESLKAHHPSRGGSLEFLTHDLADPLPWPDGHFQIALCNYVVLNHLPKSALPRVVEELCRVATYRVIATVRALASPPTGCIIGTEQVREYHQDCSRGELALLLQDGTEHRLTFNLYSAESLKTLFTPHATLLDLRAIDLFLSRFAPDAHWTANLLNGLTGRGEVIRKLKEIEESLCRLPGWIDHGTHVLIVAQPFPAPVTPPSDAGAEA